MTSRIIYHDFSGNNPLPTTKEPESTVSLTAAVLAKGRHWAAINNALHIACIFLCGACTAVGVFILALLSMG